MATAKEISAGINAASTVLQTAKILNKTLGRQSVTRMASDSILQFPMIISSDIPTDKAIIVAKAFERNYAALMIAIFSRDPAFSFKKYADATEYIKSKHNNSSIPSNIRAAANVLTESYTDILDKEIDSVAIESATFDPMIIKYLPKDLAYECWNDASEQYDMQAINDIYQPYKKSASMLKSAVEAMNSAGNFDVNKFKDTVNDIYKSADRGLNGDFNKINDVDTIKKTVQSGGFVERNNALSLLEPTMISVNLIGHGKDQGQISYNIILGVKVMIRSVKAEAMVTNVVEMCKGSNMAFKFIKFTENAKDFVKEFLFHTKQIKDEAINKQNFHNFAGSLKKRKKIDNISKFFANRLLPNTTLIITAYEAMRVKQECGVDLYNRAQALKMMDKYYLLGFAIVDTETEVVSVIFDGDTDFSETTLSAMSANTNRSSNASDIKDILKIVGKL